ncbi:hypothetical protein HXX76_006514 [Chlamydomonas incerta]|uniref:PDEase domain-containing protein n=1 Tax=Chlamydomonas incerta TaxID=51695 RepID=A0A835T372_CHLIN|nr:hypothetical protein HXX76_006514 [Chlamydomonas incerta]|eukprot:KAG2436202.1 hypothetical protein HXX76_006514 [Chlamydomonas incerta]
MSATRVACGKHIRGLQKLGRVVRAYPSTVIAPLLVTGTVLALGLVGVAWASTLYEHNTREKAAELAVAAAAAVQQRVAAALAPLQLLAAVAQVAPRYETAAAWFGLLAPVLAGQLPAGSIRQLVLAPSGVVRQVHSSAVLAPAPAAAAAGAAGADAVASDGGGLPTPSSTYGALPLGTDLLNDTVLGLPQDRCGARVAVAARGMAVVLCPTMASGGAADAPSAGNSGTGLLDDGIVAFYPIFVRLTSSSSSQNSSESGGSSDGGWGRPDPVAAACGAPCGDDPAAGLQFWGAVGAVLNASSLLLAADQQPIAPLAAVIAAGYRYTVEQSQQGAPNLLIAASAGGHGATLAASVGVSVPIALPGGGSAWTLYVAPGGGGWGPSRRGGFTAAVVVVALGLGLVVFALLAARRKQELILRALLPKEILHDLSAANSVASLGRATLGCDTPADLILGLIHGLVTGQSAPDLRHVVLIRTALLRGVDVYQPLDLRDRLKESGLATDVAQALLRQLGDLPGAGGGIDGGSGGSALAGYGPGGAATSYYYLPHVASGGSRMGHATASMNDLQHLVSGELLLDAESAAGDDSRRHRRLPPRRKSSLSLFYAAHGGAPAAAAATAAAPAPPNFDTLTGALSFLLTPAPPPQPPRPPPPRPHQQPQAVQLPTALSMMTPPPMLMLVPPPAAAELDTPSTAAFSPRGVPSDGSGRTRSATAAAGLASSNSRRSGGLTGALLTLADRIGGGGGRTSLGDASLMGVTIGGGAGSTAGLQFLPAGGGGSGGGSRGGTPRPSIGSIHEHLPSPAGPSPLASSVGQAPSKLRASEWLHGLGGSGGHVGGGGGACGRDQQHPPADVQLHSCATATSAAGGGVTPTATASGFAGFSAATMATTGPHDALTAAVGAFASATALPSAPPATKTPSSLGFGGYFGGGAAAAATAAAAPSAATSAATSAAVDILLDMPGLLPGTGSLPAAAPVGASPAQLEAAFISAFSTAAAASCSGAGGLATGGGGRGGGSGIGLTIGDRPLRRLPTASPSGGLSSFGSKTLTPMIRQFRELRRRASSRFLDAVSSSGAGSGGGGGVGGGGGGGAGRGGGRHSSFNAQRAFIDCGPVGAAAPTATAAAAGARVLVSNPADELLFEISPPQGPEAASASASPRPAAAGSAATSALISGPLPSGPLVSGPPPPPPPLSTPLASKSQRTLQQPSQQQPRSQSQSQLQSLVQEQLLAHVLSSPLPPPPLCRASRQQQPPLTPPSAAAALAAAAAQQQGALLSAAAERGPTSHARNGDSGRRSAAFTPNSASATGMLPSTPRPAIRGSADLGAAAAASPAAAGSAAWASGALLASGALERAGLLRLPSRQLLQPPPPPQQQQQQQPLPPQPPPPPVIEEVERLLAGADAWQFDMWRLAEATSGHALSCLGFYLLQREGLIAHFRIRPHRLARLLRALEDGYRPDNPYHSATHAADVLQTLHVVIRGAGLTTHYLDKLGLLAAYFAAVVHDHGHPGLTNDFLIATHDPLAVRYNDRSPLENHHAASSFALLLQPEHDITTGMEPAERVAFRKQVIDMVLATDMKQHFAILSHFNTVHRLAAYKPNSGGGTAAGTGGGTGAAERPAGLRARTSGEARERASTVQVSPAVVPAPPAGTAADGGAAAGGGGGASGALSLAAGLLVHSSKGSVAAATAVLQADAAPPRPLDDTERMLTLQLALKVADIGHLGEDLEVHCKWLAGLEEEFFRQGDRERELGLPISPLFDRAKQGVSKSQVGFYDFVALPLVHALSSAFPNAAPIMECFVTNYDHWKRTEATATAAAAQQPQPPADEQLLPAAPDPVGQRQDGLQGRPAAEAAGAAAPQQRREVGPAATAALAAAAAVQLPVVAAAAAPAGPGAAAAPDAPSTNVAVAGDANRHES